MFIIKELTSWMIILCIIIINTLFINNVFNQIMFTLFYVISYLLCTHSFLSIFSLILLGLIFDSIYSINIGISSIILIIISLITWSFKKKIETYFFLKYYLLGSINFILLVAYIKIMKIFFPIPFINLINFYIISILVLVILLPITFIINKVLNNVK